MQVFTNRKAYHPYASPFDPCPPIKVKTYVTPPQLYVPVQPPNLPQFPADVALKKGTLWPLYYDPYFGREEGKQVKIDA